MTVVGIIDNLTAWVKENICNQVEMKKPVSDTPNSRTPIDHRVTFVHPEAFPLYVPAKDRIPPNMPAPIPSICVQLMEGKDDLLKKRRYITARLCLACWNPGYQSEEVFIPHEDTSQKIPRHWTQGDPEKQEYLRNFDGWRDVWNFTDKALHEIEGANTIAGMAVVLDDGIEYGPFQEDGTVWDYYPYWHSWITFKLECGLIKAVPEEQQNIL